jgi:peroxiredoxin
VIDPVSYVPLQYTLDYNSDGVVITLLEHFTDWSFSSKTKSASYYAYNPPAAFHKADSVSDVDQLAQTPDADTGAQSKSLPVGSVAPDFKVQTPDDKTVKLSDYSGKIVIVKFWSTWCGPCQSSLPHFEQVWLKLKDNPEVAVIAPCVWDNKAAFRGWVKENIGKKYTFPVTFDPAGNGDKNVTAPYGVEGIPQIFVIGKDGKIAASIEGFDGDGDHRLEDSLAKLGVAVEEKAAK